VTAMAMNVLGHFSDRPPSSGYAPCAYGRVTCIAKSLVNPSWVLSRPLRSAPMKRSLRLSKSRICPRSPRLLRISERVVWGPDENERSGPFSCVDGYQRRRHARLRRNAKLKRMYTELALESSRQLPLAATRFTGLCGDRVLMSRASGLEIPWPCPLRCPTYRAAQESET
jgi:hypothetical protein